MPDEIGIDSSDFSRLVGDVSRLPVEAQRFLPQALEVTAGKVRDTARKNATGMEHAPAFPQSITYDFVGDSHGGGTLGAFIGGRGARDYAIEVGPDKDRPQGALGNLIEYGSVNNAPQGIMHGALQEHEGDLARGAAKAVDDGLRAAGFL
jgi:hypothetical protein